MTRLSEVPDIEIGATYWFEYHCWESDESADAPLWHHSHQQALVVNEQDSDGLAFTGSTYDERAEAGCPRVYTVRFADGLEWAACEDELLDSPGQFERPDPPALTTASITEGITQTR